MAYKCRMQKPASYQNKKYGTGTIGSSACGPAAVCNALLNAGIADASVPTMCEYSVSVGARIPNQGTDMGLLMTKVAKRYGFTYRTTNKNADLWAHLKAGGTAVLHTCGVHPWFADGGHFIAAIGCTGSDTVIIADSLYYASKWGKRVGGVKRSSKIKPYNGGSYSRGLVTAPLAVVGAATTGRSPCYYLISKPSKTTPKKEDDEVVTKTNHVINGKSMQLDAITKNGTTYVEERALCDALGLDIDYNASTKAREINTQRIKLRIDGKDATVDGNAIVPGMTMASVRQLAELLGYNVRWDGNAQTIVLDKAGANYD